MKRLLFPALVCACLSSSLSSPASAQMVTADRMTNYDSVFGLAKKQKAQNLSIAQIGSSLGANVLHLGENISLTFRIQNASKEAVQGPATIEVIGYGTSVPAGDVWVPTVSRTPGIAQQTIPVMLNVPGGGQQIITVAPPIPNRFGAYALVLDAGNAGRAFAATVARVIAPDPQAVDYPAYALDMPRYITPSSMALFRKIGAKASRMEIGAFDPAAPDAAKRWAELDEKFKLMKENNVTVMLTVGVSDLPQPLGRPRPHLDADNIMLGTKSDMVWLPEHDEKFREWIEQVAVRYGYPNGPVNAMELWNEPWEGISISGWGADMPRYRELYRKMAAGIIEARRKANVQVLIGGASSGSNTLDKLFADGSDEFLPILDFASIHYQPMAAAPALVKKFRNRKSPNGPVQTWDTESWIANSEDRVSAVIASMRAMGQERTKGIFGGNVYDVQQGRIDGKNYDATQAWPVAPAIAAVTKFIGNRNFKGLVFQNGLPWIFAFQGAPAGAEPAARNADNGTLVVVGDLSGVYDENLMLHRNVLGLQNQPKVAAIEAQLAALPSTASSGERKKLETQRLQARLLSGGTLTISDSGGRFKLFDYNGNPVAARGGQITVPLDTLGYYLRTDGSKGSFAALEKAVANARIEGYEPLDIVALDFLAPLSQKPMLRLQLTNILNRPVSGELKVQVAGVSLAKPTQKLTLKPGEIREVAIPVTGATEAASNTYALQASFDAGRDGEAMHRETIRANVIARKNISVDGDLNDWSGVLPQKAGGQGIAANLTEKAWLPFLKYDEGTAGVASGYLAYDDQNLYFAAKIADTTPDEGTIRFATRDDDQFYYPKVSYELNVDTSLQKKDTVVSADTNAAYALQKPEGDGRQLGLYETTTTKSFAVDVSVPKGQTQQVALYFVDTDQLSRRNMTIQMLDAAGKVLDTRTLNRFTDGRYLVYSVSDDVRFKITTNLWTSAVLGAVFFDPTTETSTKFVREDADTAGDWKGKYGALGYHMAALNQEKITGGAKVVVPETLDKTALTWPDGVRHFSYRMRPILPFNTGDDVQIAFNVIPDAEEPWLPNPPGVPARWEAYKDTDYEYLLHKVNTAHGGGTEVWRLDVPGMPRKHFYPRQPKWPGNAIHKEGAVENAKLAMTRDGNTRLVEAALPWSEIPHVRAKMLAGQPVKLSFRIGDNKGQPYELAQNRSVSKNNFAAFHPDFATHWANELEFGWGK